ncbi:MAG: hypothetical protein WD830_12010 [Chloroflexota bacterium]
MDAADDTRSKEACPVCGERQLTLLRFPTVDVLGVQPYAELIGMGDPSPDTPPGIGCLACGSEWPDLNSFRRAQQGAS